MRPSLGLILSLILAGLLVSTGCHREELPEPHEITRLHSDLDAIEQQIRKDRYLLEKSDANRMPWTALQAELDAARQEQARYHYGGEVAPPGGMTAISNRITEREQALAQRQRDHAEAKLRITYNERAKLGLEKRLEEVRKAEPPPVSAGLARSEGATP